MSFEHINHNGISYYRSQALSALGIEHGFCDASLNFNKQERDSSIPEFCRKFGVSKLHMLNQQHTDKYLLVNGTASIPKGFEADAFIIDNYKDLKDQAFGIITADCLPIILHSGETLSLVHSGWRGLANGIIEKTLARMNDLSAKNKLTVVIGPAAGENIYEVGEEVLEQIGENAVYKKLHSGKYLLSLSRTAEAIIKSKHSTETNFISSGICVISNPNFYSHRREGGLAGRNLSFVKF